MGFELRPVNDLETPDGLDGITGVFGDIRPFIRGDGSLDPKWECTVLGVANLAFPLPLSWDHTTHVRKMRVHRLLVSRVEAIFQEILDRGLDSEVREFGGAFAFRTQRGSARKLSTHAWGIALDINPTTADKAGLHPGIVETFERYGFRWGGDFGDPMHFQFAKGF